MLFYVIHDLACHFDICVTDDVISVIIPNYFINYNKSAVHFLSLSIAVHIIRTYTDYLLMPVFSNMILAVIVWICTIAICQCRVIIINNEGSNSTDC